MLVEEAPAPIPVEPERRSEGATKMMVELSAGPEEEGEAPGKSPGPREPSAPFSVSLPP